MDPREEDELRQLIRKELESREELRKQRTRLATGVPEMNEERRKVIEAEIEAFYRARGGYLRVENEEGEVEWLSEQELSERERQIPVDMEELEEGQRRVRWRMVALIALGFICLILLFFILHDSTGTIQVICNIPGATITIDGSATEFVTDARLDHLRAGPHLITVSKFGYVPDGQRAARVDLKPDGSAVVTLKLKPGSGNDTLGR
jgi:hypothetical protein